MVYLRHVLKPSIQRVLCSDLLRARGTGEILAAGLGLPIEFSPALRELNSGVARGMLEAEAVRLELPRTLPELDWVPFAEGDPCSVTHLRIDSHGCRSIGRLNDTSHLFAWPEGHAP